MLHEKFQQMFKSAKTDTEQAILFYHRLMETFKFAYAKRMHLGDDRFDNCTDIINELTSEQFIDFVVNKINDSSTFPSKSKFYDVQVRSAFFGLKIILHFFNKIAISRIGSWYGACISIRQKWKWSSGIHHNQSLVS